MKCNFFIGPMTKNVVDAVIDFSNVENKTIALIPSRRQIEFSGGYVNNWTTSQFFEYVKTRTENVLLVRDHAGPDQGNTPDDGTNSLDEDCKYFDVIHIDPWKAYPNLEDGARKTLELIKYCLSINPKIKFEIGTEQAIRYFEVDDLRFLINFLKKELGDSFDSISYLVIQSGTSLKGNLQTGCYDKQRLEEMIKLCKEFELVSKEHNGDYLEVSLIKEKMDAGLDSINIAPEFGLIETEVYLEHLKKNNFLEDLDEYWKICFESGRWKKWVDKDFKPEEKKEDLIKICGHYVISDERFKRIIDPYRNLLDMEIKSRIYSKIKKLYG